MEKTKSMKNEEKLSNQEEKQGKVEVGVALGEMEEDKKGKEEENKERVVEGLTEGGGMEEKIKVEGDEKENGNEKEKRRDEVEFLKEEIQKLSEELLQYKKLSEEYKTKWLYTYSEFETFRRRVRQDIDNAVKSVLEKFLFDFFELGDAIENALRFLEGESRKGVELIYKSFLNVLLKNGVEKIGVNVGDNFSPSICEAVGYEEVEGEEDGKILKILRSGYKIGDRVIRPALVIISKRKEIEKKKDERIEKDETIEKDKVEVEGNVDENFEKR